MPPMPMFGRSLLYVHSHCVAKSCAPWPAACFMDTWFRWCGQTGFRNGLKGDSTLLFEESRGGPENSDSAISGFPRAIAA